MSKQRFDIDKAIEVILYIASRCPYPYMYHIGKILYFADRLHLEQYGRLICNDYYVAIEHGPVPDAVYNIIKLAGGKKLKPRKKDLRSLIEQKKETIKKTIKISDDYIVTALRPYDEDFFSESDTDCLNQAIKEYGNLNFLDIKKASHDIAFENTPKNSTISVEKIAKSLKDGETIIEYLNY